MPKIKTFDETAPYTVPDISVPKKGVHREQIRTPPSSGKSILAHALGEAGEAVSDVAKYLAVREAKMLKVQSDDLLADLQNTLNERYATGVAPLKSGSATDVLQNETEFIQSSKDAFLEKAEGKSALYGRLSVGYNSLTQKYLRNVLNHKLAEDLVYERDTTLKVAKLLQAEMSTLGLSDSKRAVELSKKIDSQLTDYPDIRDDTKLQAWQSMFKFNARAAPEATQRVYTNEHTRKSIVAEIGSEGYDSIQAEIDDGRSIGLQDRAIKKVQAKEEEDKRIETHMGGAVHLYLTKPEQFNRNYIDKLPIPTSDKRILIGLFNNIKDGKILTNSEVDWPIYAELLDQVRLGKLSQLSTLEVNKNIINAMNREITIEQGQSLLKALASRDIFEHPTIISLFDDLDRMRKNDEFDSSDIRVNQLKHMQALRELLNETVKVNGDPKKIQEFYDNVLIPPIKKGFWRGIGEDITSLTGYGGWERTSRFKPKVSATVPTMREDEITEINNILWANGVIDKKTGRPLTTMDLTDEAIAQYLTWVRSSKYRNELE